jgi:hypothetical protein
MAKFDRDICNPFSIFSKRPEQATEIYDHENEEWYKQVWNETDFADINHHSNTKQDENNHANTLMRDSCRAENLQ